MRQHTNSVGNTWSRETGILLQSLAWRGTQETDRPGIRALAGSAGPFADSGPVGNTVRLELGSHRTKLAEQEASVRGCIAEQMASSTVESFVAQQLQLLELERDAEVEERR